MIAALPPAADLPAADLPAGRVAVVGVAEDWGPILAPGVSLLLLRRAPVADASWDGARVVRLGGAARDVAAALRGLATPFAVDAARLALRFAALMGTRGLRVRLEPFGAACVRLHADQTDVRLIAAYRGAGTLYGRAGEAPAQVPQGWAGLFKGARFAGAARGGGHAPCLHRSPAAGAPRIVLTIDTDRLGARAARSGAPDGLFS